MSSPRPPSPPRRAPAFRPRFTIGILYLVLFAAVFMVLMSLPGLLEVLEAGGDEETLTLRAAEVTRANARPYAALALSLLVTGLGAYYEVLPGLREG